MNVLVACEESQEVCAAFRTKGHRAFSCDIEPPAKNPDWHLQCDVRTVLNEPWDLMVAHPPCTALAVSGNRWYANNQEAIKTAFEFFMLLYNAPIAKIAVENPVGRVSTLFRPPDQYIQPWMFGHGETKKTGLWLKGLPCLTPTDIVPGREQRVWRMAPGPERTKLRSRTYPGIAKAMADQWG